MDTWVVFQRSYGSFGCERVANVRSRTVSFFRGNAGRTGRVDRDAALLITENEKAARDLLSRLEQSRWQCVQAQQQATDQHRERCEKMIAEFQQHTLPTKERSDV